MLRKFRTHAFLTLALAAGAAFPAYADCTYPRAPASLPNGTTATMEEMVEGQKQVKQYMADMDVYLKCLDGDKSALPADATDEQKKEHARLEAIRVQKHNAAVGEMETVAERFNEQLRAYRERQPKKG
jgi:alkanesulfonate monooxygenase SsuD/methylene tetrahydromethanopterin reductase-like flavin-dependent oxidoreductase (luciferase family)